MCSNFLLQRLDVFPVVLSPDRVQKEHCATHDGCIVLHCQERGYPEHLFDGEQAVELVIALYSGNFHFGLPLLQTVSDRCVIESDDDCCSGDPVDQIVSEKEGGEAQDRCDDQNLVMPSLHVKVLSE